MAKTPFLAGVHHQARAIIFMVGALVFYCFWLWLWLTLGVVSDDTSSQTFAFLLLLPLLPVAGFDLRLRLSWTQATPSLYPRPPSLRQRLLEPPYGLYWFPVLICVPLWVWTGGLLGWILYTWIGI